MKITLEKVKQYNSIKKYIVSVDSVPIVVCNKGDDASKIISYLNGYNVDIKDRNIANVLDKVREKGVRCVNDEKSIISLREYMSGFLRVVTYKNKPIVLTKSLKRAKNILAYLNGEDIKIFDGFVQKILNRHIS